MTNFGRNPHWVESLRELPGTDPAVREYVLEQPGAREFLEQLEGLFGLLLPAFVREGKAYLSIGTARSSSRQPSGPGRETVNLRPWTPRTPQRSPPIIHHSSFRTRYPTWDLRFLSTPPRSGSTRRSA